ncbi:hypothetical protein [Enterococcus thailandicus]
MKKIRPFMVIGLIAFIFILPHLFTHQLILGADASFHYNRFYETAQQIKNHNFHYFISVYGFQQSGRIVNAVYGPFFAYFQGLLVLISGSWFHYQIVSNFILYLIAGCSMITLLKYAKIVDLIVVPTAVIFMSTYSIQYWTINQGFTSWGTAFLPLCLLPIVDFIVNKKFPLKKVAVSIALMTQIHLLSTIMLILMYVPFYVAFFFSQTDRGSQLLQLGKSILLYFLLTANIWVSLLIVYSGNDILAPFVNKNMSEKAINLGGNYWLHYPRIFPIILAIGVLLLVLFRKKLTFFDKLLFGTSLFFLLLSTSLVPWTTLITNGVPFIRLIQFPFRFFVPFTVLFLLLLALVFSHWHSQKWLKVIGVSLVIICTVQTIQTLSSHLAQWEQTKFVSRHTYLFEDQATTRKTFFNKDLETSLFAFQKTTPDYLPIYQETSANKYDRYSQDILDNETKYIKSYSDGALTVTWKNTGTQTVKLPIIVYDRTKLVRNGHTITDYQLTDIGTPIIKQHKGINKVTVHYSPPFYFYFSVVVSLVTWGILLLFFGYQAYKAFRKSK